MKLDFYDINVDFRDDKIYFKNKKLIYSTNVPNIGILDFEGYFKNTLVFEDEVQDNFELDKRYFMIANDEEIYGIILLAKGDTYVDSAGHDERVIIKSAFPNMKCNVVGEEES